jgi:hypothetical protein
LAQVIIDAAMAMTATDRGLKGRGLWDTEFFIPTSHPRRAGQSPVENQRQCYAQVLRNASGMTSCRMIRGLNTPRGLIGKNYVGKKGFA